MVVVGVGVFMDLGVGVVVVVVGVVVVVVVVVVGVVVPWRGPMPWRRVVAVVRRFVRLVAVRRGEPACKGRGSVGRVRGGRGG